MLGVCTSKTDSTHTIADEVDTEHLRIEVRHDVGHQSSIVGREMGLRGSETEDAIGALEPVTIVGQTIDLISHCDPAYGHRSSRHRAADWARSVVDGETWSSAAAFDPTSVASAAESWSEAH